MKTTSYSPRAARCSAPCPRPRPCPVPVSLPTPVATAIYAPSNIFPRPYHIDVCRYATSPVRHSSSLGPFGPRLIFPVFPIRLPNTNSPREAIFVPPAQTLCTDASVAFAICALLLRALFPEPYPSLLYPCSPSLIRSTPPPRPRPRPEP